MNKMLGSAGIWVKLTRAKIEAINLSLWGLLCHTDSVTFRKHDKQIQSISKRLKEK